MTKLDFILTLHKKLGRFPKENVEEHLNFYIEMIEDRMEEGLSQEEAVAAVGPIDEIAAQIAAQLEQTEPKSPTPPPQKKKRRKLGGLEITLLIIGAPVWLSLLIAALAAVFSLYVAIWSVVSALWSVFTAVFGCAAVMIIAGIVMAITGGGGWGWLLFAGGLVCAGITILLFFACIALTKGTIKLTKWLFRRIRNGSRKKEDTV